MELWKRKDKEVKEMFKKPRVVEILMTVAEMWKTSTEVAYEICSYNMN